ncbi:unnamed protein product [Ambrosiozyma monospora]|uniref:Unnamed protein product n=1 Tax=Ambrosiozyma monospora TaxID=43982 RepID=A0ACB5STE1_AMBMO|nr:unnamed protein product [Ambrosiozyma monospora]
MAPKRPLGLGKASKAKKQKLQKEQQQAAAEAANSTPENVKVDGKNEEEKEPKLTNELTVELADEVDPNDPLAQLLGLWKTWLSSERDNELILNGIIHECDRILRNCKSNGGSEDMELTPAFYSIYALSLSHLAAFHVVNEDDDDEDEDGEEAEKQKKENEKDGKKSEENVKDFFDNALERVENGLAKFPNDESLLLTKVSILLDRIPLEHISQMEVSSTLKEFPNVQESLDLALDVYNKAIKQAEEKKNYKLFNDENTFEILKTLDDLLDIIDNFGKQHLEALDSDDEDDEVSDKKKKDSDLDDVLEEVELSKDHPLYAIQQSDKYNQFWRDAAIEQLKFLNLEEKDKINTKLQKLISQKIGQSYLMEAEGPISIFNTLEYDNDDDEEGQDKEKLKEIDGLTSEQANKIAKELVETALKYLKDAYDEEDPKSWVDIAEAEITYGNLFELKSRDQEKLYLG